VITRQGGCVCGKVRFAVSGNPISIGLCHCGDCRKTSGSHFSAFAIWPIAAYSGTGELKTYAGRSFCPECGSRIVHLRADEAEILIGSLDDPPSDIVPEYEVWTCRRESWMHALPWAEQFDRDRN
jgi:hypothetical protein